MPSRSSFVVLVVVAASCSGKGTAAKQEDAAKAQVEPAADPAKGEPEAFVPPSQDDGGPRIEFGELVLEGPRDGSPIIRVAHGGLAGLRKCYADRLAKDPELGGGEVAVRFLVSPSGSVEDALLHNNKLSDHRVGTCMLSVVKTWKFPTVDDPEPTPVILPMTLTPPG